MEVIEDTLNNIKLGIEKQRCGLARLCELKFKLADLESGTDVTMVKKRDISMRELFAKWQSFQDKFDKMAEGVQVGNAGDQYGKFD